MRSENKISVLLVEDHSLVRRGLRRLLEDEDDIVVVGEAGDGGEAITMARNCLPDVIVMDCAMPGVDGLEATATIRKEVPAAAILMLSMHSEDTWVRRAFAAGARGYILKSAAGLDLTDAVRRVASGEQVVDPRLEHEPSLKGERDHGLTARELQILQMIASGKSNKEIAAELQLSSNTVAVHRANIMDRLGVHKTAELVVYAIRHGLVNVS